ncbi:MAG TPA: hypothetical protein VFD05_00965 [Bacilli bacterium]|nr:hypothetical protein [Bacilli bacterium]
MKERILKSNRNAHYKVKLVVLLVLYFVLAVIVESIIFFSVNEDITSRFVFNGMGFIVFSLIFAPLIILTLIKIMQLRNNFEKYELYNGVITAVNAYKKHTFHHTITILIPSVGVTLQTKVYFGYLYGELKPNTKVEVAYLHTSDEIIILDII